MNIPLYVYMLALVMAAGAGTVTFFTGLDPNGGSQRVRAGSIKALILLAAVMVILVVLDLA